MVKYWQFAIRAIVQGYKMLYAGWDASGTANFVGSDSRHDPYVSLIVGVHDFDRFEYEFNNLRDLVGLIGRNEFHAHNMQEELQSQILEIGMQAGMVIVAVVIDKTATRTNRLLADLPSPQQLQLQALLRAVKTIVAKQELEILHLDEDFQGKRKQQEILTDVRRIHRSFWPNSKLKVAILPSYRSSLIQLADICAYTIGKAARSAIRTDKMKQCVRMVYENSENIIGKPEIWEG